MEQNPYVFTMMKNIIIEQNKQLLRQVAHSTGLNESYLLNKYLRPEYYLPIFLKDVNKNDKRHSIITSTFNTTCTTPHTRQTLISPLIGR